MKKEMDFARHVAGCSECKGGKLCGKGLKMVATMVMPEGGSVAIAKAGIEVAVSALGKRQVPEEIQWMPPGRQAVTPMVNGEAKQAVFVVDSGLAAKFSAQLGQLLAAAARGEGDMPFIDFNHNDDEASGHVMALYWGGDDPKEGGIRARVDWTAAGKAALEQRLYRRFSPEWKLDKDTLEPRAIGVNLGGLVNKAAFKNIQPVVAKDASERMQETNNGECMNGLTREEFQQALAEGLKPITERIGALETATATAKGTADKPAQTAQAGAADDSKIIQLLDARLKPVTEQLTAFAKKAEEDGKTAAKNAVQAHVNRGAIAPADTETISFYETAYAKDAAATEKVMAKLPGKSFTRVTTSNGGTATATAGGPAEDFIAKAKAFGKEHDCKNDAESLIAFGRTPEGAALYQQFRETIPAAAAK